ncbi:MmcQ/YjbR family DNA-binding protein [Actinomycetes bacterium M1A6_2h]
MATLTQAISIAAELPEVTEGARWSNRTWFVRKKAFAWERPLNKADVKRFGDDPVPAGPIFAVSLGDLGEKEAVLAEGHRGVFTIEHFANHPAVLIELDAVEPGTLTDLIVDAWLAAAPTELTEQYLADNPTDTLGT